MSILMSLLLKKIIKNKCIRSKISGLKNILQYRKNEEFTIRTYSDETGQFKIDKDYILHNLDKGPENECSLSKAQCLDCYKNMVAIRKMEIMASKLYLAKEIRGFLHLYNGQEACATGMKFAMREQDDIIGAYRIHGVAYLMGISIKACLAELCGKSTGCQMGKGGSMHMYSKNFFGGNGIVGAQVPVGTGIAKANQYKDNGGVCFTLFGDGAMNQGQIFESFNMARLWKLPVVYIVENNGYGMGTSVQRASALPQLFQRGHYIPGVWVDGMDLIATINASKFAIEHALKEGPILLEYATYRYFGHSMSDPGTTYRSREEVQEVKDKMDPIKNFKSKVNDLVPEDEFKKIDDEINAEVKKAVAEIKTEKELPISDLAADVYVKSIIPTVRNNLEWKPLQHKNLGKPFHPE